MLAPNKLIPEIVTQLTGEPFLTKDFPPEVGLILSTLSVLFSDRTYRVLNENEHYEEFESCHEYGTINTLARWDGSAVGSAGYGSVHELCHPLGVGLAIAYAGSQVASAGTLYVVPCPR